MASNNQTWRDYYDMMDGPTMVIAGLFLFIIILFILYISMEVICRRDFTIMRKTIWSLSFMITPGFAQLFYMFFGERDNIDAYGETVAE